MVNINTTPTLFTSHAWESYRLLDTGEGRKLEQIGPYLFSRPEPQCLWPRANPAAWGKANAVFAAKDDEGEAGNWHFDPTPPAAWPVDYRGLPFHARLGNNRHIGFFPEQSAQWDEIVETITNVILSEAKNLPIDLKGGPSTAFANAHSAQDDNSRKSFSLLNCFAYTGLLSLLAARAGAAVTHVDASKKAIEWGKENAALAGIDSVRWICEDARAFVARERRRNKQYDGIVLDPPKFGRGPDGEVWEFFDHMPALLADAAALLSPTSKFFTITGYSARLSPRSLAELLASHVAKRGGNISYGECALKDDAGRLLALNMYAKWQAE